jgi:hypothetical protein
MLNRNQAKRSNNGHNRRLNRKIDLSKNPDKNQEILKEISIEYKTIIALS